ncbi:MAG: DUF1579 domain-containing protein [Syntrophomonadaceae bacterium]
MKRSLFTVTLTLIILSSAFISAQENQQDMMKAWQEYMTPGQMHQMLAKEVGEWKTEISMWMDPGQEPTKAEGTMVCEALFDGKYFQSKHTSTFMGMPFSGIETFGYDNAKKTFFTTWIDNMGTGIMYLEGKLDEATQTVIYTGTMTDQMGKVIKVRETLKVIDNDNIYSEMYMDQNGKEVKTMETKLTRKKA